MTSLTLPAELKPEQVVAITDSREQLPLNLDPLQSVVGTLATGDYSLAGLQNHVAIERKSLPDLIGCIGTGRERFERELHRLRAYPSRAVVVEASWAEMEAGEWRSKVTPRAAVGSVLAWMSDGVPFLFCGDHEAAGRAVARMLYLVARRRYRELRTLADVQLGTP